MTDVNIGVVEGVAGDIPLRMQGERLSQPVLNSETDQGVSQLCSLRSE